MRVFVTGATGVVGRRALPLLIDAGHTVSAVGRTPEKRAQLERAGARGVELDLFDRDAAQRALAGHDAVINLATSIPPSSRMFFRSAWRENDRIRSEASVILVDAAIANGAQRFIQESFAPIYMDQGDRWIDESSPVSPSKYNRSVVDAEGSAQRFTETGRDGIVLRFGLFYGPDSEQVDTTIKAVRRGFVPMPGPTDAFLSSVSHDDAATAVVAALGARPGIYNVVDNEPLRRTEYFGALAGALGVRSPRFPPQWMTHLLGSMGEILTRSHCISNEKFRAETGWAPKYPSVREGWPATVREIAHPGV